MPWGKICCALLLPHHPGAMYPMFSLANCFIYPGWDPNINGPMWGAQTPLAPLCLDPSLELVIIPLAVLACREHLPAHSSEVMKKVQLQKGLIQNGSTDKRKIIKVHLIRPGTEDSEVWEVTKGKNTKRNRSWEWTESFGNKYKGNSMTK